MQVTIADAMYRGSVHLWLEGNLTERIVTKDRCDHRSFLKWHIIIF